MDPHAVTTARGNRETISSPAPFPSASPRQVFTLIDGFTGEIFTVDLRHPLLLAASASRRTAESTFFPENVHPTWSALRQFLFTRVLPALPRLHASPPAAYTLCTSDEHRTALAGRPGHFPVSPTAIAASSGCTDKSNETLSHRSSRLGITGTFSKNSVVLLLECTYTSLDLEVKRHSRPEEEASSDVLRPGEPGPVFFYYSDIIFHFSREGEQNDSRDLDAVAVCRGSSHGTSRSDFLPGIVQDTKDVGESAGRQAFSSAPASALASPYLHAYDPQTSHAQLGRRDSLPNCFAALTASSDSLRKARHFGNQSVFTFRLPYASPSLERRLSGAEQCAVQTAAALCADSGLQHFASSVRTAAHLLAAGRARAAAASSLLQRLPQQRRSALVVQGNLERHLELATSWLAALLRRVEDERRLQQPLIDGLDSLLNLLHSTVLPKGLQKPRQVSQTGASSSRTQPMRTLAEALDIETVHYHVDRVIAQREHLYEHLKALRSRCDEAALEASAAGRRAVSVAERAGAVEEEALRIEAAGREHEALFHKVLEALPPPPIAYSQYSPEQLEERRERQAAALQELRKLATEQAACEERLAVLWSRRGDELARAVSRVFEGKMEVKREHNLGLMLREAAQRVAIAVLQLGRLYALPRACALALQECARRRRFRCTYTLAAKTAQTQLNEMRTNEEEMRLRFLESCGHALPLSLFGALRQYEVPRVAVEGPEDFDTDLESVGGTGFFEGADSTGFGSQDKDDDSSDSGFGPEKESDKKQTLYGFGMQTATRATRPFEQQGGMHFHGAGGKNTSHKQGPFEEAEENRVEKKLLEASTSESALAATAAVEALLLGMLQAGAEEERAALTRAAQVDLQELLTQWRVEATADRSEFSSMNGSNNWKQRERGGLPLGGPVNSPSLSLDVNTAPPSSSSICRRASLSEESAAGPAARINGHDILKLTALETRGVEPAHATTTGDEEKASAFSSFLGSEDRTAILARQTGRLRPPEYKEKPRIRIRSACPSVDREARTPRGLPSTDQCSVTTDEQRSLGQPRAVACEEQAGDEGFELHSLVGGEAGRRGTTLLRDSIGTTEGRGGEVSVANAKAAELATPAAASRDVSFSGPTSSGLFTSSSSHLLSYTSSSLSSTTVSASPFSSSAFCPESSSSSISSGLVGSSLSSPSPRREKRNVSSAAGPLSECGMRLAPRSLRGETPHAIVDGLDRASQNQDAETPPERRDALEKKILGPRASQDNNRTVPSYEDRLPSGSGKLREERDKRYGAGSEKEAGTQAKDLSSEGAHRPLFGTSRDGTHVSSSTPFSFSSSVMTSSSFTADITGSPGGPLSSSCPSGSPLVAPCAVSSASSSPFPSTFSATSSFPSSVGAAADPSSSVGAASSPARSSPQSASSSTLAASTEAQPRFAVYSVSPGTTAFSASFSSASSLFSSTSPSSCRLSASFSGPSSSAATSSSPSYPASLSCPAGGADGLLSVSSLLPSSLDFPPSSSASPGPPPSSTSSPSQSSPGAFCRSPPAVPVVTEGRGGTPPSRLPVTLLHRWSSTLAENPREETHASSEKSQSSFLSAASKDRKEGEKFSSICCASRRDDALLSRGAESGETDPNKPGDVLPLHALDFRASQVPPEVGDSEKECVTVSGPGDVGSTSRERGPETKNESLLSRSTFPVVENSSGIHGADGVMDIERSVTPEARKLSLSRELSSEKECGASKREEERSVLSGPRELSVERMSPSDTNVEDQTRASAGTALPRGLSIDSKTRAFTVTRETSSPENQGGASVSSLRSFSLHAEEPREEREEPTSSLTQVKGVNEAGGACTASSSDTVKEQREKGYGEGASRDVQGCADGLAFRESGGDVWRSLQNKETGKGGGGTAEVTRCEGGLDSAPSPADRADKAGQAQDTSYGPCHVSAERSGGDDAAASPVRAPGVDSSGSSRVPKVGNHSGRGVFAKVDEEEQGWVREEQVPIPEAEVKNQQPEGREVETGREDENENGSRMPTARGVASVLDTRGKVEADQGEHGEGPRSARKQEEAGETSASLKLSPCPSAQTSREAAGKDTDTRRLSGSSPLASGLASASFRSAASVLGTDEEGTGTGGMHSGKGLSLEEDRGGEVCSSFTGKERSEAPAMEEKRANGFESLGISPVSEGTEEGLCLSADPAATNRSANSLSSHRAGGVLQKSGRRTGEGHAGSSRQTEADDNGKDREGVVEKAVEETIKRGEEAAEGVEHGMDRKNKTARDNTPDIRATVHEDGVLARVKEDRQEEEDGGRAGQKMEEKDPRSCSCVQQVPSETDREEGSETSSPLPSSKEEEGKRQNSRSPPPLHIKEGSEAICFQLVENPKGCEDYEPSGSFRKDYFALQRDEEEREEGKIECVGPSKDKESRPGTSDENRGRRTSADRSAMGNKEGQGGSPCQKEDHTTADPETVPRAPEEDRSISLSRERRSNAEEIDAGEQKPSVGTDGQPPSREGTSLSGVGKGQKQEEKKALLHHQEAAGGSFSSSSPQADQAVLESLVPEEREGLSTTHAADEQEGGSRSFGGGVGRLLHSESYDKLLGSLENTRGRSARTEEGAQGREQEEGRRREEIEGYTGVSRQVFDAGKGNLAEEDSALSSSSSGVVFQSCLALRAEKEDNAGRLLPQEDFFQGLRAGAAA